MTPPLILVFDDELVRHPGFLAPLPGRFVYRPHADEALVDVAEVDPDCVFMDFSMNARLNGAEATRLLRAAYDHDRLPIVGISSDARCNRQMHIAGANDGVVKMALPEHFGYLTRTVLRRP